MQIGHQLMQCYLAQECKTFQTNKVKEVGNKKMHTFYHDDEIYMLFKEKNSYIKMKMDKKSYLDKQSTIKRHILVEYGVYVLVLGFVSYLFALYTMRPLKKAFILNEEFVKDILHDFNTPLSALKINLKILKKKFGKDEAIDRSDEAIKDILALQENLHSYLSQNKLHNEKIKLDEFIKQRANYFKTLCPDILINTQLESTIIVTNQEIVKRIIDNLLSNGCKYNKKNGTINITLKDKIVTIEDSGIGIENPKEIFERYYKEQKNGIGIGLHIVKKLCDEMSIKVKVESKLGVGSRFCLDFG